MVIVQFTVKMDGTKLKIQSDVLRSESATADEITIGESIEGMQVGLFEHIGKQDGMRLRVKRKKKISTTPPSEEQTT